MKPRDFGFAVREIPICDTVAASSGTFLPCINTCTRRPPPSKFIAASITAFLRLATLVDTGRSTKCSKTVNDLMLSLTCGSSDFFEASLADLAVGEDATLGALAVSTSKAAGGGSLATHSYSSSIRSLVSKCKSGVVLELRTTIFFLLF
ncbi:hypothetical protein M758_11G070100, partial [Ceratodon purpureus]